ncbi:MAG: FAD-dependent oxidoreductase [Verrucomicrobia bacterium]|nr:FAD-dependent oxidoreductase [Verrucomicrobiota bacterium]
MNARILQGLACAGSVALIPHLSVAGHILESARPLPVLHDVDVVVVGGTSAGVAAAAEAAGKGARVFLAAPRPYLGEDVCGVYQLWLEAGEEPGTELARRVFAPSGPDADVDAGPRLGFTYEADLTSDPRHADTTPPGRLKDGRHHSAAEQSVQYNGAVTVWVDLGGVQRVGRVRLMAYQRPGDFEVATVTVAASRDRQSWQTVGVMTNDQLGGAAFEAAALTLGLPVRTDARYLRMRADRGPDASRILLGEIVVEGEAPAGGRPAVAEAPRGVRPLQVKRVLDQALLQAGVPFLYNCPATELLTDAHGYPAGVVVANRSGRQAIRAKVIIDATDRASIARQAGIAFRDIPASPPGFSRVVVGGPPRTQDGLIRRERPVPLQIRDRAGASHPVHEYQLRLPLPDAGFASWAEAEQLARDWTWTPQAVDASEVLFQVPPAAMQGKQSLAGGWPGADQVPLDVFRPAGVDQVFVLGGCADVSRETAALLVRPVNAMAVGARVGAKAAEVARGLPAPEGVHLARVPVAQPVRGEVAEVRPAVNPRVGSEWVPAEARALPVLGEYDVVVVGGGTGGAPAGIGAGRQGVRTLVLEHLYGLGGVGTLGLISTYYHGNRVGFTKEVDDGVVAFGDKAARVNRASWNPEHKIEWYRRALRRAGVDLWYGTLGAGAVVDRGRVTAVVVVTPHGRGVVWAKVVIDATGNADIAAAAGASCRYIDKTHVAVQGTGLPPKELGARYTNTDYTFVDDTDIVDTWRVMVMAKQKFHTAYDVGQLVDTRERRQIVGDFTLSPMDMLLGRTFPDTIVISRSNFDTHGFIVHPLFMLRPPNRADVDVRVPYRCLLPRGLDGILVTGLGISAHRDAVPVIRMQPDVQNQGYAAGVAAAMIARRGGTTRDLDLKALQRHLVEIGNLPQRVLSETDSFPLPPERVAAAVARLTNQYDGLEIVLAQFEVARPRLRQAHAAATDKAARLVYAHVLGMMHDGTGLDTLLEAVRSAAWDKGWRYTGMGQFGPSMSPLDSLIIALGRTGAPQALEPILEKTAQLTPDSEFSHFRAVAMALESLRDPRAAKPLADLLRQPGMSGHARGDIMAAVKDVPGSGTDTSLRNLALRELVLARALYRCGDHEGMGAGILRRYAADLHGHYARHAQAILAGKPGHTP